MSALEDARATVDEIDRRVDACDLMDAWNLMASGRDALRALIAEHEALIREMHQRELHHFETEKAITEALALYDAHEDVRAVLVAALTPSTPYPKGEEK